MPRQYMSSDHLWSVAESEAGRIAIRPIRADNVHFDAARSNHIPAYSHEGMHGSSVLDIGRGVLVRATGNVHRTAEGGWTCDNLHTSRDQGGDLTRQQEDRTRIDRNNDAIRLEEKIAEHQAALKILRRNLRRCDNGQDYTAYPDLPTDGRR